MPSPPDDATAERMRRAHRKAESALLVGVEGAAETWGRGGRSLSRPAAGDQWLRVLAASGPSDNEDTAYWDGSEAAESAIPASVPRPRLKSSYDWLEEDFAYRAELYERVHEHPLSGGALPPADLRLPDSWWTSLRTALSEVAATPTERVAIRQPRLDRAMPKYLGAELDTWAPEWSTAHADIQWSHLTGPGLCILGWERWGLAPAGYDAACLYISSLTVPRLAERVRRTFADVLDSPAGRFSQLAAASEYLQGMERGNNLELRGPLRRQVALLLS
ncbi:hypothetical protein ACFO3J_16715 [Streptomyces polygonati]|uniref:Uncharacterized protein n=1 Tax=Streptomyces polygonati TaxID=1617087 RepID=A0ABV8HPZ3_9ACTN